MAFLCPPSTVSVIASVDMRLPSFSTTNATTTNQSTIVRYQCLPAFIGRSTFTSNPSLFSTIFTRDTLAPIPALNPDDYGLGRLITMSRLRPDEVLANENSLQVFLHRYLLNICMYIKEIAIEEASRSGDASLALTLRSRQWTLPTESRRGDIILEQNPPPNIAAGECKRYHVVTDTDFEIITTVFESGAASIETLQNVGPSVIVDWSVVEREHDWERDAQSRSRLADMQSDDDQPPRWQTNIAGALQQTITALVQHQVNLSLLTTYSRWVLIRARASDDGSTVFELSPTITNHTLPTQDEPWLHPLGLLMCLALLRTPLGPLTVPLPSSVAEAHVAEVADRHLPLNQDNTPVPSSDSSSENTGDDSDYTPTGESGSSDYAPKAVRLFQMAPRRCPPARTSNGSGSSDVSRVSHNLDISKADSSAVLTLFSSTGRSTCGLADADGNARHRGLLALVNFWPKGVHLRAVDDSETLSSLTVAPPIIDIDRAQYTGSGAVWDAFILPPSTIPGYPMPTVLRMCHRSTFSSQSDASGWTRAAAINSIFVEHRAYTLRLTKLQGKVVPEYLGLWKGFDEADGLFVSIQSWAGVSISNIEHSLDTRDRQVIQDNYRRIHDAGVVQGDVAKRHWLKHPSGQVFIIDFNSSVLRRKSTKGNPVVGVLSDDLTGSNMVSSARLSKLIAAEDGHVLSLLNPRRHS